MSDNSILIIGAGPLGLSCALMLAGSGIRARVVDARPSPGQDGRMLALSEGSRQILARLHAWPEGATPIEHIHISQQGGFGRATLHAHDHGLAALGQVLPAADLAHHLLRACDAAGIAIEYGVRIASVTTDAHTAQAHCADGRVMEARLLVRAEGSVEETTRLIERDYQQDAILCSATPAKPHGQTAFERFTPQGPFALLPMGAGFSVVATAPRAQADALLALPDADFLAMLQNAFGSRVTLTQVGPRSRYPLKLRARREIAGQRVAWLGNAAQTLHPVAGQGFNLALRDAWSLASLIARHPEADPGGPDLLARFSASRRLDRASTIGFTDALIRVFANHDPLLNAARGVGLLGLAMIPPARDFLARRMMFGLRG